MTGEPIPILLVDDDEMLTRTFSDILGMHGFAPVTAGSGAEALGIVRTLAPVPAVAVVDLKLPDMDGLDLGAVLREYSPDIQVIVLTGYGTLETAIRALRDANSDYLLKPVDPDLLVQALRTAEGRWRLRRTEAELDRTRDLIRTVFDASPLPIAVLGADLRVQLWNRSAEKVFGLAADHVIGRPAPGVAGTRDQHLASVVSAALGGESITGVELRYRRKDDTLLDLRLSLARLTNLTGGGRGLVAVFEDATEHRRIEAHLQSAQRLDAIGRLAGGVAHDFNNLLAVVLAEVEAAFEEGPVSPTVGAALESVRSTAQRGATLTKQLLSFARRQETEPTIIDVNDVIQDLGRVLGRLAGTGVDYVTELAEGIWPISVDRGQLEQVLTNLVVNARDAMPEGGRLVISTANVVVGDDGGQSGRDQGEWVSITVTDTGTGIPEAIRAKIFEPFFTTKEREAGTGLGLATCYGIVERFGGAIAVESALGRGSAFRVHLPRSRDIALAADEVVVPIHGTRTESILLVEDQTELRAIVRATLTRRGYSVHAVASGHEALRLMDSLAVPPRMLITDVHLADIDGRDLVRRAREKHPALRALVTSGTFDATVIEESGVPFLAKPYSLEGLAREVRSVLDRTPP